ncbi:MAG: hypothetical protein P8Y03_29895, partial [Anaerolineales bacterium]
MSDSPENHPHMHGHHHDHTHAPHNQDLWGRIAARFHLHHHDHHHGELASDQAFLDDQEGIRAVWLALAALTLTSILQLIIVVWSGSIALFADTLHNIGDGL